jgi:hypothetical protein
MWDMKLMLVVTMLVVGGCATAPPSCVGMVGTPDQVGACFQRQAEWERQQEQRRRVGAALAAGMSAGGAGLQQRPAMRCTRDVVTLNPGSMTCQ